MDIVGRCGRSNRNSIGLCCQVLNLVIVKKGEAEIPGLTGTRWPPFRPLHRLVICALREAPFPVLFPSVPAPAAHRTLSHARSALLVSTPCGGLTARLRCYAYTRLHSLGGPVGRAEVERRTFCCDRSRMLPSHSTLSVQSEQLQTNKTPLAAMVPPDALGARRGY